MAGYIGSKAVNLSTTGADINGDANIDGDLSFRDNDKVIFGAGSDLQIYHDGSNSYIDDTGTGQLLIRGRDAIVLEEIDSGDNYIYMQRNNKVELYYSGSAKLATTSTGVDITGVLSSDGLHVVKAGDNGQILIGSSTSDATLKNGGIAVPHYTNAEEDLFVISGQSNSTYSNVYIGGGAGGFNAATGVVFYTGSSTTAGAGGERMRITSAGNVGIGTSSPSQQLTLANSSSSKIQIKGHSASNGFFLGMDSATAVQLWNAENGFMRFATNDSERMRIDSSGNLLVGRTTLSGTDNTQGAYIFNEGALVAQRSSNVSLYLNRYGTDGDIALFRKDGSTVGSTGVKSSNNLYIAGSAANHAGLEFGTSQILPMRDTASFQRNLRSKPLAATATRCSASDSSAMSCFSLRSDVWIVPLVA